MSSYLFTSESVSEGHPDKLADQISDAVLDAILAQDKRARVAKVINDIGYDNSKVGFDGHTCAIINMLGKQSPDIAAGVDGSKKKQKKPEEQGAGDQGLMFGYACNEAPEFMPAPIYYSHRLVEQQAKVRKNGKLKWLRPDAKSQVTLRYSEAGHQIEGLDAVVLSTQHDPEVKHKDLVEGVYEHVLKPVLPKKWLEALPKKKIHIRPRSTVRPLTPPATWPRTSSPPAWPTSARCRSATRSASPSPPASRSPPSAPARSRTRRSRS